MCVSFIQLSLSCGLLVALANYRSCDESECPLHPARCSKRQFSEISAHVRNCSVAQRPVQLSPVIEQPTMASITIPEHFGTELNGKNAIVTGMCVRVIEWIDKLIPPHYMVRWRLRYWACRGKDPSVSRRQSPRLRHRSSRRF